MEIFRHERVDLTRTFGREPEVKKETSWIVVDGDRYVAEFGTRRDAKRYVAGLLRRQYVLAEETIGSPEPTRHGR